MRLYVHDDPAHVEASELLPWYVNGTLSPDERRRVAEHLHTCLACHQESLRLRELQTALQQDDPDVHATAGLERLRQRLDLFDAVPAQTSHAPRRWVEHFARAGRWLIDSLMGPGSFARVAALILGAALIVTWTWPESNAPYRVLSAPTAGPAVAATASSRIVIVLRSDTTEARMRAMLQSQQAHVVDGPSSEGAYTLAVEPGRQTAVLQALRGQPEVLFAEPAPPDMGAAL